MYYVAAPSSIVNTISKPPNTALLQLRIVTAESDANRDTVRGAKCSFHPGRTRDALVRSDITVRATLGAKIICF